MYLWRHGYILFHLSAMITFHYLYTLSYGRQKYWRDNKSSGSRHSANIGTLVVFHNRNPCTYLCKSNINLLVHHRIAWYFEGYILYACFHKYITLLLSFSIFTYFYQKFRYLLFMNIWRERERVQTRKLTEFYVQYWLSIIKFTSFALYE